MQEREWMEKERERKRRKKKLKQRKTKPKVMNKERGKTYEEKRKKWERDKIDEK